MSKLVPPGELWEVLLCGDPTPRPPPQYYYFPFFTPRNVWMNNQPHFKIYNYTFLRHLFTQRSESGLQN